VVAAVGDRTGLVVVGQSFGAFTAPLVADRLPADVLVLVAGMIPSAGEAPNDWWDNTGYRDAVREQAARDGGQTGNDDPFVSFYHDVRRKLAEESMSRERAHPSVASMSSPCHSTAGRTCRPNSCCARKWLKSWMATRRTPWRARRPTLNDAAASSRQTLVMGQEGDCGPNVVASAEQGMRRFLRGSVSRPGPAQAGGGCRCRVGRVGFLG
jgi:hypothetical protein